MKHILNLSIIVALAFSCSSKTKKEDAVREIYKAEKEFEKMAAEKGVAEAFYFFADDSATIRRGSDSLIKGKENIKTFYSKTDDSKTKVNWTPDFVKASDDGTLGYTYGNYIWAITDSAGKVSEYKGIFHTVWKKQKDNSWKYVWD
jgi:ketosteroid isomerase-like protein